MVDYSKELEKLREMHEDFLLRYATSRSLTPSEQEVRDAGRIKQEIRNVWNLAIYSDCIASELELVDLEETLERMATKRNYSI